MAMGQTEASKKARKMDKREILSFHWAAKLGVLRRSRGTRRNHPKGSALLRPHSPARTAHENQRRCKPVYPRMGTVLRGTPGREDGTHPERETATALSLERTKWSLPSLPPEDHQTDGVEQPPHRASGRRWGRSERKPSAAPPQLP